MSAQKTVIFYQFLLVMNHLLDEFFAHDACGVL